MYSFLKLKDFSFESVFNLTFAFLKENGIENAKSESIWLIENAFECNYSNLLLCTENFESNYKFLEKLSDNLRRRIEFREPLQYILGNVHFYDIVLKTDKRALIPRPETEFLVEKIISLCENIPNNCFKSIPNRILDLGTGSGAIAISLAKTFSSSNVFGIDFSDLSIELASENAILNDVKNVQFFRSNWFENVSGTFDLIISNPPYLSEKEWDDSQKEIKLHEPKSAFVSKNDGLHDLKFILQESSKYLNKNGCIFLETGINQHEIIIPFAKSIGYKNVLSLKDLTNRERFIFIN